MTPRLWLLGAPDPEMERIAALLAEAGEAVAWATAPGRDGPPARVTPAGAYGATGAATPDGTDALWRIRAAARVVLVECAPLGGSALAEALAAQVPGCGPGWAEDHDPACPSATGAQGRCLGGAAEVVAVDHHRPGDPGYGRPPAEFLAASSLGQVLALLGRDATPEDKIAAAADHCLTAAYAGACPGVDPAALAEWRDASRAVFQRRPVAEVRADREAAELLLRRAAGRVVLAPGVQVVDLRPLGFVPELAEAAARLGVAVLYRLVPTDPGGDRSGRVKVGILGAGEGTPAGMAPIEAFLGGWAAGEGLVGLYGDPARGYAGGYEQ